MSGQMLLTIQLDVIKLLTLRTNATLARTVESLLLPDDSLYIWQDVSWIKIHVLAAASHMHLRRIYSILNSTTELK